MTDYTGHTPGPWEWLINKRDEVYTDLVVTHDEHKSVMEVNDYYVRISDADARLIAAAPDLLAGRDLLRGALKNARAALLVAIKDGVSLPGFDPENTSIIREIDAALKNTGADDVGTQTRL